MDRIILKLYSNCIIVAGIKRTIICDLQRHKIYEIPFLFRKIFEEEKLYVDKILNSLNNDDKYYFLDFIKYLITEDIAFWCSEKELNRFPIISREWDYPSHITNCILDANDILWYFNSSLLKQLELLCCNHIQIRFYESPKLSHLSKVIKSVNKSQIKSLDIVIKIGQEKDFIKKIKNIVLGNKKIRCIIIHSSDKNYFVKDNSDGFGLILEIIENINDSTHCGVVHSQYFSINVISFTEAHHYNTCLNRKISIDINGEIKNCPSTIKSYGNIKTSKLIDALNTTGFKDLWSINKDKIDVCKLCEFRYVCIDCRAFLESPKDVYSKPLKCGYNPNTGVWEDWSLNPLKLEILQAYRMQNNSM